MVGEAASALTSELAALSELMGRESFLIGIRF